MVDYACPTDGAILARLDGGPGGTLSIRGNITISNTGYLCSDHNQVLVPSNAATQAAAAARAAEEASARAAAQLREQQRLAQLAEQQRLEAERQAKIAREKAEEEARKAEERRKQKERELAEERRVAEELKRKEEELAKIEAAKAEAKRIAAEKRKPLIDALKEHHTKKKAAFVGKTGAGKSQLYNSINGLNEESQDYSPVAEGVECTGKPHLHVKRSVVTVDLPGGATEKFPAETYCEHSGLDQADLLLMCYTSRFSQLDGAIARYAHEHNIPMVVVYTQTDVSVSNVMRRRSESEAQAFQSLRQEVVADVQANLQAIGMKTVGQDEHPVFFVDSLGFANAKYDEAKLRELLENPETWTASA